MQNNKKQHESHSDSYQMNPPTPRSQSYNSKTFPDCRLSRLFCQCHSIFFSYTDLSWHCNFLAKQCHRCQAGRSLHQLPYHTFLYWLSLARRYFSFKECNQPINVWSSTNQKMGDVHFQRENSTSKGYLHIDLT